MDVVVWGIAVLAGIGAIGGALIVAFAARTAFTIGGIGLIGLGVSIVSACVGRLGVALLFAATAIVITGAFAFIAHLLLGRGHTADAPGGDPAVEAARPQPRLSTTATIALFAAWLVIGLIAVFVDGAVDRAAGPTVARGPAPVGGWLLTLLATMGLAATQILAVVFLLNRPAADERSSPDAETGAEGDA